MQNLESNRRDMVGRTPAAPDEEPSPVSSVQSETRKPEISGTGQAIAIVGMACRFPGAPDLASFWRLLESGGNAVTEGIPASGIGRFGELFPNAAVQNEACRFAAFVAGIDRFDASFFRISPLEAQLLDPQQRMMLETSWQALEDGGLNPEHLEGSRAGVYAGISHEDYLGWTLGTNDTTEPAASLYTLTGASSSTNIGRVAFALGLEGPAIAVDTACSSSLVAIHQAILDLQQRNVNLALAGGVNAILLGRRSEMYANAGMLSPDGRCKTFDAAANGYVRGEGCGIVALKRLDDAEADGDRIWAVIRGAAVNQDGAGPGLTMPNGAAQERVIAEALSRAGVLPSEVDYLEAHGTGTQAGDPVEAHAAAAAYGKGRATDRPLLIGSVKTNIGHLESAAGIAGLIKVVLSMNRRLIPKHLHFRDPNPRVDWERLPLKVAPVATDWPRCHGRPALAGVNGFGWSGTNAHLVVQDYEPSENVLARSGNGHWPGGSPRRVKVPLKDAGMVRAAEAPSARRTRLLPLSAKSPEVLPKLAERYLDWLDEQPRDRSAAAPASDPLLSDMAWTAGVGRSHFSCRKGLVFRDAESLRRGLRSLAAPDGKPVTDAPKEVPGKVAFAYTGQASQWVGMGRDLYECEPVARTVLDRCDEVLRAERGASLLDVMFGRDDRAADLDDASWTQPAIYALETALTALWASLGIRPDVVVGHSLGEIAAAHAAGVFGHEDGLRFAAARGALMAAIPQEGAMAAILATETQVAAAVEELNAATSGTGLGIAVDNGPSQVVSGPAADVEAILTRFESEGVQVRRLRPSPAYHSALVEPALDGVEAALRDVTLVPPSVVFVSALTGRPTDPGSTLDGPYWRRHAREPVAFRTAVETLAELGVDAVVEIGPHAVLGPIVTQCWSGKPDIPVLSSLRRPSGRETPEAGGDSFVAAAAEAYEAGLPLSFDGLFAGEERCRIALPGYPFLRERHWFQAPKRRRTEADHSLLGARHESASGEITFETELSPSEPAWLAGHRVFGRLVAPSALYGAMMSAATFAEAEGPGALEDVQLYHPLILSEAESGEEAGGTERKLQVILDDAGGGPGRRMRIMSRGEGQGEWTLHAEARLPAGLGRVWAEPRVDTETLKAGLSPRDVEVLYRAGAEAGIALGPTFRTLDAVWSRTGESVAEVVLPEEFAVGGPEALPILLDGCFQTVAVAYDPAGTEAGHIWLPFGWERMRLPERLPRRLVCQVRMREDRDGATPDMQAREPPEVLRGDLRIYDPGGTLLGEIDGYTVRRSTRAALLASGTGLQELLYEVVWRDQPPAPLMPPADFRPDPAALRVRAHSGYLADEGVESADRASCLEDMDRLACAYALSTLEALGWDRRAGTLVAPEELRRRLAVAAGPRGMFSRLLEMLAGSGVLGEADGGFRVRLGSGDPLPEGWPADADAFAVRLGESYPHGATEIGLMRRCGNAMPDVLRGRADPLAILFHSGEPTLADLYSKPPAWRAANRMLADAVRELAAVLPEGRPLRVLEVGAGTGSATASVLPHLPTGRFEYVYTDVSSAFFANAEARFGDAEGALRYRMLDIERDPVTQGFPPHGYDLLIAANVLHATRDLRESLTHCRRLLVPSGQLLALELLPGRYWLDIIGGQLDGWSRFDDEYRTRHLLVEPSVWRQAFADVGLDRIEVLGAEESDSAGHSEQVVIAARAPAEVPKPRGLWVLAADRGAVAAELAAALQARNQQVILASAEATGNGRFAEDGDGVVHTAVEMERRESWQDLIRALPSDVPLAGVVHLVALDGHGMRASTAELACDARRASSSALALLQGVDASGVAPVTGVWLITRGAQVLEPTCGGELAGALLWGLGRTAIREAAHLQPRMVDLDPQTSALDLAEELLHPDHETHIAYRAGIRRVARLVRAGGGSERPARSRGSPDGPKPLSNGHIRPDRSYLVTGGLGGMGLAVAGWLADRGAGAIVLNGRRPPDGAAEETVSTLEKGGATVRVELADVTDADAVDGMLERIEEELPPLGGVIHSVGVLSDSALANQSWERFESVLWPKVLGGWHLHRATERRDLHMFVLFSSMAGVLGSPGQANHAAANAFLDQLAAHRRALGLPGQAIAWGPWAGLGEAEEQEDRTAGKLEASATASMSPRRCLHAFEWLASRDIATAMVAPVDWPAFSKFLDRPALLLEELITTDPDAGGDAVSLSDDLLSRLMERPRAAREELIVAFLQQEVRAVLQLTSAPAPTVAFFDLGIDSLMALELRNRLNRTLAGAYVPPNTVVVDHPDIAALARHVAAELDRTEAAPAPVDQARTMAPRGEDGVAIVGMACRFPGASDLAAFWSVLSNGRDAVTDGRLDPGSWDGLAGDPAAPHDWSRVGGFIEGIEKFDAAFFGIAPLEAHLMDPRQRLLLELSWHALEDAGIDPRRLKGSRTGVWAGLDSGDYRDLAAASGRGPGFLGNSMSVATGRIAFALGLNGPAVSVDMACASSLAAAHQASTALRQGEVDLAIVGAANAVLSPAVAEFMRAAGVFSASGRCRTFDAAADGFVRGEGGGIVVLKRLTEAQADGDRIRAVIRGSAVNQSGAAAGLTVPNGPAQERVIEEALARAGVPPAEVDYLEAHGMGSAFGDSVELRAAAAVYGRGRETARPLLMGSVKTNIGHLECAAGMASLIKSVLAMNHGLIPRHLHFDEPNPHLDWDDHPVRVTSQATPWPRYPDRAPLAGISAFGFTGANVHVVVEGHGAPDDAFPVPVEAPPAGSAQAVPAVASVAKTFTPRVTRLLPLSGKTGEALQELADRYLSWLDVHAGARTAEESALTPMLADMAWTAGVGRSHFAHRAAIAFHDVASLRDGLLALREDGGRAQPVASTKPTKVAFAYAGQASSCLGAGWTLYECEPAVREVLDRCDAIMREERGASLLDEMFGRGREEEGQDRPTWARPAVYAFQCALTALWGSVGIRPSLAFGQDVGEIAAAQAADVFSLEDGLRVVAAAGAGSDAGAGNAPPESARDALRTALADIALAPPSLVLVSGATGHMLETDSVVDAEYWLSQARQPAAPGAHLAASAAVDVETVMEIGPRSRPSPFPAGARSAGTRGPDGPAVLCSLREDAPANTTGGGFVEAVAGAYEAGLEVAFVGLFAGEARRRISLPVYPFERQRYWFHSETEKR